MPLFRSNTCQNCPHTDHSGAFTPGGARPVCRGPGLERNVSMPGDKPEDPFLRAGFSLEDAVKLAKGEAPGKYHWIHRIRPADWGLPDWCPLPEDPSAERDRLREQNRDLVEALESIAAGCRVTGRWLDEGGTAIEGATDENDQPEEGATWGPYTEEDQAAWIESCAEIAADALAKARGEVADT